MTEPTLFDDPDPELSRSGPPKPADRTALRRLDSRIDFLTGLLAGWIHGSDGLPQVERMRLREVAREALLRASSR